MKYQFMDQQRRYHRVGWSHASRAARPGVPEKMARVLDDSRGGYYAWRTREASKRAHEDALLVVEIRDIQENVAKYRYGSQRVTAELRKHGLQVGHNRVARLMRANGLNARPRKKFRVTTISGHKHQAAPNVVDREFRPERANQVWASDATYIATAEGWLYLFVIIDLYSRRVVGWAISKSLGTSTLLQAFWMAVACRGAPEGLIFHSDRGVQYAATRFRNVLRKKRIIQSMSRKGNCWDNACVESFFKSLESELIGTTIYESREAAMQAIFEYIEAFYNRTRLHSTLNYRSPVEYEEARAQKVA
jgi:putative transposase